MLENAGLFFQPILLHQQLNIIEINLNMKKQWFLMKKSREKWRKPHFWVILAQFLFIQKSDFVTFLDLLKTNLMQKKSEKIMVGNMSAYGQTDG